MCYVYGCKEPTALLTWHRLFGDVVSCAGHNPEKHGYGRQARRPIEDETAASGDPRVRCENDVHAKSA